MLLERLNDARDAGVHELGEHKSKLLMHILKPVYIIDIMVYLKSMDPLT
jgi:hypothetical protein